MEGTTELRPVASGEKGPLYMVCCRRVWLRGMKRGRQRMTTNTLL